MAKKRGLKINIKINLTNRWLYTLIAIGILAIISVGVYAIDTSQAWHPTDQIEGLGTLATKDSVSWTEISNRPVGLDDGDDVGGGLWQTSGDDIYYDSGKVGIGVTTPAAELDVEGDIMLTGKIKIVKRYLYDYITWGNNHLQPRCPCDTNLGHPISDTCGEDEFYTNIDSGSTCYDWYIGYYGGDYHNKFTKVSGGPWVAKTFEYP